MKNSKTSVQEVSVNTNCIMAVVGQQKGMFQEMMGHLRNKGHPACKKENKSLVLKEQRALILALEQLLGSPKNKEPFSAICSCNSDPVAYVKDLMALVFDQETAN